MPLRDVLLVILHLMEGGISNQFSWNLHLFLYYMWYSDCLPTHDLKFTITRYGPWCHKILKEIDKLEDLHYISSKWSIYMHHNEIDDLITNEFVEPVGYYITEAGRKRVDYLYNKYTIKDDVIKTASLFMEDDIPYLIETVHDSFPEMIRSKHEKCIEHSTVSNNKRTDRVSG